MDISFPVYLKTKEDSYFAIFQDGRYISVDRSHDGDAKSISLSFGTHFAKRDGQMELFISRLMDIHKTITPKEFEDEMLRLDESFREFSDEWVDSEIEDKENNQIQTNIFTEDQPF